jgi:hypothetical protein
LLDGQPFRIKRGGYDHFAHPNNLANDAG